MKTFFALLTSIFLAFPALAEQPGILVVQGAGRVEVAPDMATVLVGVQHQAGTAKARRREAEPDSLAGAAIRCRR